MDKSIVEVSIHLLVSTIVMDPSSGHNLSDHLVMIT